MKKRIFTLLLAFIMLVGMLPVNVFATEATETTEPTVGICETEGCEYVSGHEGNCSNYVEPNADELAAMAVIDLIDAIGTVTLESEAAISAADTAYNALTDEQKALVTNLDVLEAAKTAYAALSTPAPAAYQGAIIYEYGVTDSSKVPNALGYFIKPFSFRISAISLAEAPSGIFTTTSSPSKVSNPSRSYLYSSMKPFT